MEQTAVMVLRPVNDEVIDACRRGDTEAYRMLFETHKDRVYSIAFHFTGNETAAKDVTQQVFLKLITSLHTYRKDASFTTWLYRLVANACIDEHRRTRRFVPIDAARDVEHREGDGSAYDALVASEAAGHVRDAVAALRPKLRIAVLLRYFEGLSYEEIADALGCSKGTVASAISS